MHSVHFIILEHMHLQVEYGNSVDSFLFETIFLNTFYMTYMKQCMKY